MKRWVFKTRDGLVTVELPHDTLNELFYHLESAVKHCGGLIKAGDEIINVRYIERVCEERLYINGTVKL